MGKKTQTHPLTTTKAPNRPGPQWFKDAVLVVPDNTEIKRDILNYLHDAPTAGYPGRDKTIQTVKRQYWWPGMNTWIEDYMKGCTPCHIRKFFICYVALHGTCRSW
jgi:hypothetical protein